jgi:hypothetical protein
MSIDAHRVNLSVMERSDFLARIKAENNWTVGETAAHLQMPQSRVSNLLKFQEAGPELRAALHAARVDQDKALAIICKQPDSAKQCELLKIAKDYPRDQLRRLASGNVQPNELKASVARFQLPKGITVTVSGPRMNITAVIEALTETLKALRKGHAESLDLVTICKIMKDRALAAK